MAGKNWCMGWRCPIYGIFVVDKKSRRGLCDCQNSLVEGRGRMPAIGLPAVFAGQEKRQIKRTTGDRYSVGNGGSAALSGRDKRWRDVAGKDRRRQKGRVGGISRGAATGWLRVAPRFRSTGPGPRSGQRSPVPSRPVRSGETGAGWGTRGNRPGPAASASPYPNG